MEVHRDICFTTQSQKGGGVCLQISPVEKHFIESINELEGLLSLAILFQTLMNMKKRSRADCLKRNIRKNGAGR